MLKSFKIFIESADLLKFKEEISKSLQNKDKKTNQIRQEKDDKDIKKVSDNIKTNIKTIDKKKKEIETKNDYVSTLIKDPDIVTDDNIKKELNDKKTEIEKDNKVFKQVLDTSREQVKELEDKEKK